jgi:hypothetical protein
VSAKTKGVRSVRRMLAYEFAGSFCVVGSNMIRCRKAGSRKWEIPEFHPVAVVSLRKADVDALIDKVARHLHGGSWTYDVGPDSSRHCYIDEARAVLTAILGRLPK